MARGDGDERRAGGGALGEVAKWTMTAITSSSARPETSSTLRLGSAAAGTGGKVAGGGVALLLGFLLILRHVLLTLKAGWQASNPTRLGRGGNCGEYS